VGRERTCPNVLLLDIRMAGMDGLAPLRDITADPTLAGTRVVVVTTFEIDQYALEALQSGASGFILKDASPPSCCAPSAWRPPRRPCCRPR
jgi:DNA-binding NarL/FixJ family response regulator